MREHDRMIACELEPRAAAALARHLGRDKRAKPVAIDGWQALKAYIPPAERRGLVLIDPPFEDPAEFAKLADRLSEAHRKWATGVYAVWYPVKGAASVPFIRQLRQAVLPKLLRVELHVAAPHPEQLTGSGLAIVNAPWRLKDELAVMLPGLLTGLQCERSGDVVIAEMGDKI
jgi:23S rRNA (adenine2030-N6)-methyltransferase